MTNTCATCAHARPHGVGYVECQIATRRLGEPVRFYCQDGAECYFPKGWKARRVAEPGYLERVIERAKAEVGR